MYYSAEGSSVDFCSGSREKMLRVWLLREVSVRRIIWMNEHYDDPVATPSCASLMFRKSHGAMLRGLYCTLLFCEYNRIC